MFVEYLDIAERLAVVPVEAVVIDADQMVLPGKDVDDFHKIDLPGARCPGQQKKRFSVLISHLGELHSDPFFQ